KAATVNCAGVLKLTHSSEHPAEVIIGCDIVRVARDDLLKLGNGFHSALLFFKLKRQGIARKGIVRVRGDEFFQHLSARLHKPSIPIWTSAIPVERAHKQKERDHVAPDQ